MALVCSLYLLCFQDLVENHVFEPEEVLSRKVKLVLTDPPYNVRRDRRMKMPTSMTLHKNKLMT